MPRSYDKTDLRAEVMGAKMSTDKLRKELNIPRKRKEIAGWSKPYEVLMAKPVEQQPAKKPYNQPYKSVNQKPKQQFRPQFKKAF
jgi:hypothetical protein